MGLSYGPVLIESGGTENGWFIHTLGLVDVVWMGAD
jgi:hypothetical protein